MARDLLIGLLVVTSLTGCGSASGLRSPGAVDTRPYLATRMCVFQVDAITKEARLRVALTITRALPMGSLIVMQFEAAGDPSTPATATRIATGREKTLDLVSPAMNDIRVRSYETVTRIYSSPARERLLGTHVQACQSPFDQRDLGAQFH